METRKLFMVLLLTMTTAFGANADNDKPVRSEELPETAKKFINTYFDKNDISYAKKEKDFLTSSYEVFFVDGRKVEFDSNGNWDTVDCRKSELPQGIVPVQIGNYVKKNHPDCKIVKIERDRKDYEIDLNNGIEIKFNLKFEMIGYDD